ncbi:Serine/threonine-protein kinase AFC1 [Glycine soja]|uniref:Serine/threonine-protein kinase AFC1 n=1 Tax=Glycine soja TaxID=3848 RepID=A0A445FHY4_GLYSO|nr:Serine/threonine-protein kinase AFC1 [Glycine soja]
MISSENKSNEDINHRFVCAKLELIVAKMEANAKIKKYEETVKHLYKLLKKVCQERDEARGQLQLIRNFQASTPAETSSTIPQVDHPCLQYKTKPSLNSTKVSNSSSKVFSNHPCDLSLSSLHPNEKHSSQSLSHTRIAEPSNLTLTKQPNHMKADIGASRDNNMVDGASLVFDKLVCGKPLPQIGRLLQSVTEAGPLLQTLLVAPAPQWQNPPSLSSSGLTLGTQDNSSSTNTDDKANVNPNGFIPTSLGLVFPGNSHVPSQMSYASGFGLALKNELVSYVLPTMYCKQEVRNGMVPNHAYPFVFYRGMPRNGSPPGGLMIKTVTMFLLLVKIKHLGVFEKLGPSLYDFLRKNNYRSLSIDLVREFGRQLLESVAFMHHTDLKPENILLVSSEFIKVPDYKVLGGTMIFGVWAAYWLLSFALGFIVLLFIAYEQGEAVFQTHENLEHLAMMERVLEPLPPNMVNLIRQHVDHSAGDLIDLLQGLLRYDPSEPLKAKEAMRHHFFFTRDTKRYGYPL